MAKPTATASATLQTAANLSLWVLLLVYAGARILQLVEVPVPRLPILLVVGLHVIPSALFAWIHGAATYGKRGMLVFTALCLGVASGLESLSLRTGFPFGHYRFTEVMGPKILQLPVLLAFAYLGMGYVSWTLATILVKNKEDRPVRGIRIVMQSLVASCAMVAWDLAMDPVWATIDRAWIWKDGGAFFGVPISNYFGWFLTVFTFYALFAIYLRSAPIPPRPTGMAYWRLPILFYLLSALGNILLALPHSLGVVTDPTGKSWQGADILGACVVLSVFVMLPFPVVAWLRLSRPKLGY